MLVVLTFFEYSEAINFPVLQIFRKEPFFYGHDNYDQLVKIAKVSVVGLGHSLP